MFLLTSKGFESATKIACCYDRYSLSILRRGHPPPARSSHSTCPLFPPPRKAWALWTESCSNFVLFLFLFCPRMTKMKTPTLRSAMTITTEKRNLILRFARNTQYLSSDYSPTAPPIILKTKNMFMYNSTTPLLRQRKVLLHIGRNTPYWKKNCLYIDQQYQNW